MKQSDALAIFDQVYDAAYREVYSYILAKTGDIHSAPEILNDSFVSFYKRLLTLRKDTIENKRAYLFSIVQKNLSNYYKEKGTASLSFDDEERDRDYTELIAGELSGEFLSPTNQAETRDLIDRVLSFVAEKPLSQRRAFVLHFMFDYPVAKVAEELSVSPSCAGNYIYRLLKEVRAHFQEQYNER